MLIPERVTDDTVVTKSFCAFEIKDAEKGEVEAIVATLDVVDRDEDIIRADAIPDGVKVLMSSYGHDAVYGARPAGKGKLYIEANKVVFKGRVFLTTSDGRDTFECLKEMGSDQEWSFGFRIMGAEVPSEDERKRGARRILTKLDAFEVSPVIVGAGVGTRTIGAKAAEVVPPLVVAAPVEIVPPDPEIEAKRLADEKAESDRRIAELKEAAVNHDGDRRFRRPPAGIVERRR
jgi:prohead serine protease